MSTIGNKIREIRGKESRSEFAARFDIHPNTLMRWEKDERSPDVEFIKKVALSYQISPEWLISDRGERDAPAISPEEPQSVATIHYANLIDECNELRKENKHLWPKVEALTKENGELRVEIEKLKSKLALLEQK